VDEVFQAIVLGKHARPDPGMPRGGPCVALFP
jgi:hypothetical protein